MDYWTTELGRRHAEAIEAAAPGTVSTEDMTQLYLEASDEDQERFTHAARGADTVSATYLLTGFAIDGEAQELTPDLITTMLLDTVRANAIEDLADKLYDAGPAEEA